MKIRQLPDTLANKIAAGEVVERPASVVKELLENSIDADSSIIKIILKESGLREITVIDNGEGMVEADCKHAFLRHATSKIQYDQDLFHIKSLGFRGEALASISSVSKLTIKTSTGELAGTSLYLEAGKLIKEKKSDARKGTEITVSELFFNTPARLKYMKSIHTELGHITDLINRYALAHPNIRFEIVHNDKVIFKTMGTGNQLQVIQQIYGTEVTKNMLHVRDESLDFEIDGYIAKPNHTRASRNYITLIVNGRYIKNHALTHAIIRGFGTLLMIHRYPIAVLSIKMAPILTDVNVHPTKLEIRFSKERELTQMVEQMIGNSLKRVELIPSIEQTKKKKMQTEQESLQFNHFHHPSHKDNGEHSLKELFNNEQIEPSPERLFNSNNLMQEVHEEKTNINTNDQDNTQMNRIPAMYPIGQLQGTYILAQNEQGFYMIDQHAAQERIKYEFFKKKLGETAKDEQQLLMPLTFEFTNDEIIFINKHHEQLHHIGLFLEHFGGQTYAVRSYPSWFPTGLEEQIIRDIVNQVIHDGTIDIEKLREEVAILMSCKKSIKANHYLTHPDMQRLLEDLSQTKDPFTCPHGRPVIIHFTYYEIEKMFKRTV